MTTKTKLPRQALLAATAVAFGVFLLGFAADAQAQRQTPNGNIPGVNVLVTQPKPPVTTPTPTTRRNPPPLIVTKIPPPVIVVNRPDPTPRMPDRPGTFVNLPSDMRSLTQFGAVTSIERLLTAPGVIDLTVPRQAVPNLLENRPASKPITIGRARDADKLDARQALENAKPLI